MCPLRCSRSSLSLSYIHARTHPHVSSHPELATNRSQMPISHLFAPAPTTREKDTHRYNTKKKMRHLLLSCHLRACCLRSPFPKITHAPNTAALPSLPPLFSLRVIRSPPPSLVCAFSHHKKQNTKHKTQIILPRPPSETAVLAVFMLPAPCTCSC